MQNLYLEIDMHTLYKYSRLTYDLKMACYICNVWNIIRIICDACHLCYSITNNSNKKCWTIMKDLWAQQDLWGRTLGVNPRFWWRRMLGVNLCVNRTFQKVLCSEKKSYSSIYMDRTKRRKKYFQTALRLLRIDPSKMDSWHGVSLRFGPPRQNMAKIWNSFWKSTFGCHRKVTVAFGIFEQIFRIW